jgi:hypothetical protein
VSIFMPPPYDISVDSGYRQRRFSKRGAGGFRP